MFSGKASTFLAFPQVAVRPFLPTFFPFFLQTLSLENRLFAGAVSSSSSQSPSIGRRIHPSPHSLTHSVPFYLRRF